MNYLLFLETKAKMNYLLFSETKAKMFSLSTPRLFCNVQINNVHGSDTTAENCKRDRISPRS